MFVITARRNARLVVHNAPAVNLILQRPKRKDILFVTTSCVATFPPCLEIGQTLSYPQRVDQQEREAFESCFSRVSNHSWISGATLAASRWRTVKTCPRSEDHVPGSGEGIC